jgi:protein gp37
MIGPQRHKWSDGIEQKCLRKGCEVQRKQREGRNGTATSTTLYRLFPGAAWAKMKLVPRCHGRES